MSTRFRLAASALLTDLGLYLLMLSLPYRLVDAGASSAVLGTIPLLLSGPYGLMALIAGRISDGAARRGPIRAGLSLSITAAVALALVESQAHVLMLVPAVGIGLGFFWPSLQAGFSEVSEGRDLHRLTGLFNVSWSLGKGIGLLGGGLLTQWIGPEHVGFFTAGVFATSALMLPRMPRPGSHADAVAADTATASPAERVAFRRTAWIANGLAFAMVATITNHLPRILDTRGLDAVDLGTFTAVVFATQTLVFVVTGPRRGWHFRAGPLLGLQVVLAIGVLAVARIGSLAGLVALAPLLGLALGFAYQSSLYYSLHAPLARGANAGVHEAVLGLASATVPVLGGLLVASQGLGAPFGLAAVAMALSTVCGAVWITRARRPR